MRYDPGQQEGFEKIGSAVGGLERAGRKVGGRVLSKLVPPVDPRPLDWGADARWALEDQNPRRARMIIYIVFVVFLLLFAWAALAPLDEVVHGVGKAIPVSGTQTIQSVDGGVVEEIFVSEAQRVDKDTLLLRVDPTRSSSMLGQQQAKLLTLKARAARLTALSSAKPFVPPPEAVAEMPQIVDQEMVFYRTSLEELNSRISVAKDQLSQRRQELAEANSRLTHVLRAYDLAGKELAVTRPLLASGAVPKVEVMRLEKEEARAAGERDQARSQIARIRAGIEEAEGQVREVELRYRNAWRNELSATLAEMETLTQGNKGLADRLAHSDIRSPIKGTVKRLFVNTPGGVILPGGVVAEIVPIEDALVVEAQLSPKDRAFIQPGQAAVVKFTAYEYAVYGGLDGVVEYIAPDTITDQRGNTFYQARIRTNKEEFGADLPILPGMVAQVDIMTGKKTILSYLLKPLLRARANALRER